MLKNLFLVCKRTVAGHTEENKLEYGFEVLNTGMAINTKNTHYISSHYLHNNHTDGMCHVMFKHAHFRISHPMIRRPPALLHCLTQPFGRTISYHLEEKKRNPQHADDRCSAQVVAASFLIVNHSPKKIIIFSISMATDMQLRCNPLTVKTYDWYYDCLSYHEMVGVYIYIFIDLSIPIRSSTQCEFVITRSTITVKYYIHLPYKPQ